LQAGPGWTVACAQRAGVAVIQNTPRRRLSIGSTSSGEPPPVPCEVLRAIGQGRQCRALKRHFGKAAEAAGRSPSTVRGHGETLLTTRWAAAKEAIQGGGRTPHPMDRVGPAREGNQGPPSSISPRRVLSSPRKTHNEESKHSTRTGTQPPQNRPVCRAVPARENRQDERVPTIKKPNKTLSRALNDHSRFRRAHVPRSQRKVFTRSIVRENLVGNKLGEFSPTRIFKKACPTRQSVRSRPRPAACRVRIESLASALLSSSYSRPARASATPTTVLANSKIHETSEVSALVALGEAGCGQKILKLRHRNGEARGPPPMALRA